MYLPPVGRAKHPCHPTLQCALPTPLPPNEDLCTASVCHPALCHMAQVVWCRWCTAWHR